MRQMKITKQITSRETVSLEKYLYEISRESLITAEEEVVLARKIHDGDASSLDKMVRANLRFVVSVSKQYQNQGLSLPDLINEGNLGLIKAAQRFDETRGFKFVSYAVWWIRQSILVALTEQARIVRLPSNKIGDLNRMSKTSSRLQQKFEREPTEEEIADTLGVIPEDVRDTIRTSGRHVSMDEPIAGEDSDLSLNDLMTDPNAPKPDTGLDMASLNLEIKRSLTTVTTRESDIVKLFFGLNGEPAKTLEEIGEKFNLTRERVRQIKEKAIRRLRHSSRSKLLKAYLG